MTSNLTFFRGIIAGDSWGSVAVPLIRADAGCGIILLSAILATQFGLLNTIAAVVVDRQVQAREEDHDYVMTLKAEDLRAGLTLLKEAFAGMAGDDLCMDLDELNRCYDVDDVFRAYLNRMDLH